MGLTLRDSIIDSSGSGRKLVYRVNITDFWMTMADKTGHGESCMFDSSDSSRREAQSLYNFINRFLATLKSDSITITDSLVENHEFRLSGTYAQIKFSVGTWSILTNREKLLEFAEALQDGVDL